ncbi:Type II secretion system (T2SS), protein F [Cellulomonas marina]|uniref:Type II secretion system (T2SS), protein F n=1 Tax=Cellulomonas marina TaxID=988821 RepID=A0A1I0XGF8_9CELL|nr:Type II secretion system (T2SS), protein F [Cellulomonas marina]
MVELVAAAVGTGAPVPRVLDAVGAAIGGGRGQDLRRVAAALLLGATWGSAWEDVTWASGLAAALAPAWAGGAPAAPGLRALADRRRREQRAAARAATGALGVRLLLPLGTCLLPAFVLLGLVPVVLSLLQDLLG